MSNIFLGKTNYSVSQAIINKLNENYMVNKNIHHIVLVPDRVSMLTEIKIFETLKIESTTSIEVLTMSRLASKLLDNVKIMSKNVSCMLIQKILKENKENLKCFNKNIDIDTATNLFETISQFKSCKIDFDQIIVKNKDKILEDKLEDISFIYEKYEQILKEKKLFDTMDKLNFLQSKISNCDYIKNSIFYISNFDGFTFQGFQLLTEIVKTCKETNIGVLYSDNLINEHIYDKSFLQKVESIFKSCKITPNYIVCKDVENEISGHIRDNLFGFNLKPLLIDNTDKICLFDGKDFKQEVLFCASQIKNLIMINKYKFSDFTIVCPDLKNKYSVIEQIFNEYKFNFFIDKTETFDKTILAKLIFSLFDLILENFSKITVLSFIKNPLINNFNFDVIEDFEDYLDRYNVKNYFELKNSNITNFEKYENFNLVRDFIINVTDDFKKIVTEKNKKFKDFVDVLQQFLLKIKVFERLQEISKILVEKNEIKQVKIYEQLYEEINNVFDDIATTVGNDICDFNLFCSMLKVNLKNINLSTSPISTNCICVGDSSLSFFDKTKVYFALNMQESTFPIVLQDNGIISDKEIDLLSEKYLLEPSIQEINQKERFKAFDVLLKAEDKLFLSCSYADSKNLKSKIIEDIACLFQVKNINGGFEKIKPLRIEDENNFILDNNYLTAKRDFVSLLRSYIDGQISDRNTEKLKILYNVLNIKKEDLSPFYFKNKIKLDDNLFFDENKVSVSQIESFMTCPFLHYCRYGLKLQENETAELNAINVGKILHEVAQNFVKNNNLPINKQNIKNIVVKIFDEILLKEVYDSVRQNKENKILIENLKKEAIRFCEVLNYQHENTKFKPVYFEIGFFENGKIKNAVFEIGNKKIKLNGQIDRIDLFENYFRIIDYKTGNCDRSLDELFYGKKIQLDAYLEVVKNSLKLNPVGAYYLPVKGGFSSNEDTIQEKYRLKGETLNDLHVLNSSDTRFLKEDYLNSDLIEVKFLKNDNGKKISGKAKVITKEEIENRGKYSFELIKKACEDILKLDITPTPLKLGSNDNCKQCKYFGFCRFSESFGNIKRSPILKIKEEDLKFLRGDEN